MTAATYNINNNNNNNTQFVAHHMTRSATLPLFTIPTSKTEFARRSSSYVALNTWNRLPDNVTTCDNLTSLTKTTETLFFRTIFHVPKSASLAIAFMELYKYEYCCNYYIICCYGDVVGLRELDQTPKFPCW